MSDYLVKQAIENIRCTPSQDLQNRIQLAKITRYGGVYTKVEVLWRNYRLPKAGVLFHVYQIGRISPNQFGLTPPAVPGLWIAVDQACINDNTIVDFYNEAGRQHPRFLSWYTVTEDNNLVIAIERCDKVGINYDEEPLFMRTYHNAYYGSERHDPRFDYIDVKGKVTYTTDDVLQIQNAYTAAKAKGAVYGFVNGYLVDSIDLITAKPGDVLEYVFDGSIYAVEDFNVGELGVFDSTLDKKRKYLLHSSKADKRNITFHDDIDFYVMVKDANGRIQASYMHRNQTDSFRQVTHADYSVSIPYLDSYITARDWGSLNDLTIRAYMRKAGYRRPLVYEANRIHELYNMEDADILAAMIGIDATVPEWQAAHLEASSYTAIMAAVNISEITPAVAQAAYGYNSMSQILAPTPQFTQNVSGEVLVDIPLNLQYRSTVYEYDFNGKLLGWYLHHLGALWRCQHSDTHMVQIISGYAVKQIDERYGQIGATLDANLDYRMYTCGMFGGLPDNLWQDVTDSAKYVVNKGSLTWLTSPHTTFTMVRSNRDFLGYDMHVPIQGGVLRFALSSDQDRGNGPVNTLLQIPLGELDIFLNQNALVEDIDYIVDFPEIVVISKKYLKLAEDGGADPLQDITVRFCGHSRADMSRTVIGDRGFVSHGVLSNNSRYDIHKDKVQHIAVGGSVYDKSELTFAEDHSGVNVPGVASGLPYVVRDIVVPMRGTTNAKTYELRDVAVVTDKHVSDYLTMKLPQPNFPDLDPIEALYPVYSPFVSALIDDLKTGQLDDGRINSQYNDDAVRDICKFYEPLLAFEPTRDPHKVDTTFVDVQAYYKDEVSDMTIFQYRFLNRAVSLYLNNAVKLSHYVRAV